MTRRRSSLRSIEAPFTRHAGVCRRHDLERRRRPRALLQGLIGHAGDGCGRRRRGGSAEGGWALWFASEKLLPTLRPIVALRAGGCPLAAGISEFVLGRRRGRLCDLGRGFALFYLRLGRCIFFASITCAGGAGALHRFCGTTIHSVTAAAPAAIGASQPLPREKPAGASAAAEHRRAARAAPRIAWQRAQVATCSSGGHLHGIEAAI